MDDHGFHGAYQSVKRLVGKLRGSRLPEARVVIETRAGEDYGEFRVMLRAASPVARTRRRATMSAVRLFP